MYMGQACFWDEKFKHRKNKPMAAEPSLLAYSKYLSKGSVLDLACGDGRNALYLLDMGYEVTALDFSREALKRLDNFCKSRGHKVYSQWADLSVPSWSQGIAMHDNIIISHYRLRPMSPLKHLIRPGGCLIVTGFSQDHVCDEKIRPDDLIGQGDFDDLLGDFDVLVCDAFKDARGAFVTYVLKRKI